MATAHRPKRDAKHVEAARKRAEKRLKTEVVSDTKVLGKRKADFDQDDVETGAAKGSRG